MFLYDNVAWIKKGKSCECTQLIFFCCKNCYASLILMKDIMTDGLGVGCTVGGVKMQLVKFIKKNY